MHILASFSVIVALLAMSLNNFTDYARSPDFYHIAAAIVVLSMIGSLICRLIYKKNIVRPDIWIDQEQLDKMFVTRARVACARLVFECFVIGMSVGVIDVNMFLHSLKI